MVGGGGGGITCHKIWGPWTSVDITVGGRRVNEGWRSPIPLLLLCLSLMWWSQLPCCWPYCPHTAVVHAEHGAGAIAGVCSLLELPPYPETCWWQQLGHGAYDESWSCCCVYCTGAGAAATIEAIPCPQLRLACKESHGLDLAQGKRWVWPPPTLYSTGLRHMNTVRYSEEACRQTKLFFIILDPFPTHIKVTKNCF